MGRACPSVQKDFVVAAPEVAIAGVEVAGAEVAEAEVTVVAVATGVAGLGGETHQLFPHGHKRVDCRQNPYSPQHLAFGPAPPLNSC